MRDRALDIVKTVPEAFLEDLNMEALLQKWQKNRKSAFAEKALAAAKNGPDAFIVELKKWEESDIRDSDLIEIMITKHTEVHTYESGVYRDYEFYDDHLPSMIKILLEHHVSLQARNKNKVPLILALEHERFKTFNYLVSQPEAKEHLQDALKTAVSRFNPYRSNTHLYKSTISTLLDKKADINKRDESGQTILFMANHHASPFLMDLLLSKGADLLALDNSYRGRLTIMGAAYDNYLSGVKCFREGGQWSSNELLFKKWEVARDTEYRKRAYDSADYYLKYLTTTIKKYLITEGAKKDPNELESFLKQSIVILAGKSANTDQLTLYLYEKMNPSEIISSIEKERQGVDDGMRSGPRPSIY